jgi:hypothetical protein
MELGVSPPWERSTSGIVVDIGGVVWKAGSFFVGFCSAGGSMKVALLGMGASLRYVERLAEV